jgi:class 3 adenylate cyclase
LLSVEIRQMPRSESRIDGDVAGRILSRCVLAALEIVSKERVPVDLAGTVVRPVVEATFTGPDGTVRAARAALAIRQAVTKVQREVELEFHVFGAIAAGSVSRSGAGVTLTAGAPELVVPRLREHAAAGEFLVSEEVRRSCEGEVGEPVEVTLPGADPVLAYPLSEAP